MAPPTLTKTHTNTNNNPTRKPNWLGCCFGHRSSSNRVFERPIATIIDDEGGNGTDRDESSYKKVDESLDGGTEGGGVSGRKGRRSKIKRYWRFCWPVVRNRAIMKKSAASSSSSSSSSSSKAKHERSSKYNNKLPWKWLGKGNNDKAGGVVEVTKTNLEQASSHHRHVVPFAQVVVVERTTTSHINHKSSQTTRQWVNLGEGPQVRQPNASNETTTSTCHKLSSSVKKPKCKTVNQKTSTSASHTTDRSKEKPGSREPDPSGSYKPPAAKRSRAGGLRGFERDCIMGASILLVTLMVMICCGRLCAILCTSVWLYFGPWLIKASRNMERAEEGDDDGSRLSSERYRRRKKVVLEGFLDRSRKQSIDISLTS